MPLQRQPQSISFAGGLDTKTDPKQVGITKLQGLVNGIFDNPGKLRKRNGYELLGAASELGSTAKAVASFKNELLAFNGTSAFSLDETANSFKSKADLPSVLLQRKMITGTAAEVIHADGTIHPSGYACYAWETANATAGTYHEVRYSIVDQDTGNLVVNNASVISLAGHVSQPKVLSFGDYILIFFVHSSSYLDAAVIPVANPTATPTYVIIEADLTGIGSFDRHYDACVINGTCHVVWNARLVTTEHTPRYAHFDDSFVPSSPETIDAHFTDADGGIAIFGSLANGVAFAYNSADGATYVYDYSYGHGRKVVAGPSGSGELGMGITGLNYDSAGTLRLVWTVLKADNTSVVRTSYLSNWTPSTPVTMFIGAAVASKLFTIASKNYVVVATEYKTQNTYFVVDYSTGSVIARMLTGVGGGYPNRGCLPEVDSTCSFTLLEQFSTKDINGVLTGRLGVTSEAMTFDATQGTWYTQELANNLHISGGLLRMFDGARFVEHGFNQYPTITAVGGVCAQLACASTVAGNTIQIESHVYTCVSGGGLGTRQFYQGANDAETASNLAASLAANDYPGSFAMDTSAYVVTSNLNAYLVSSGTYPATDIRINRMTGIFGTITCTSAAAGDRVTINGTEFIAGVDFAVGADDHATALNLSIVVANLTGLNAWRTPGASSTTVEVCANPGTAVKWSSSGSALAVAVAEGSNPVTYQYSACYEWIDNASQTHRSATSLPISVPRFMSIGKTSWLKVNVSTLQFTDKHDVRIVVYRTDDAGTNFYQAASDTTSLVNDVKYNDRTLGTVAMTDKMADVDLIGNEFMYTTGNVLDNFPVPPCSALTIWQNRLVGLDAEHPLTIWYSKEIVPGIPVEFASELTLNIDVRGGDITGLASMDEKLIPFKTDRPFYIAGQGADATGAGASLNCVPIPSSAGCVTPKSIVLTSAGLMRQTTKGIWLLDRGLSDQYVGAGIELASAYPESPVVTSALLSNTNQVRFATQDDKHQVLVYDYLVGQWSTFNGMPAVSSTLWKNRYVYATSTGKILAETSGVFSDNGDWIPIDVKTSWIQMAGFQGYERIYKALLIGSFKSACSLTLEVRYNFNEGPAAQTLTFDVLSSTVATLPLQLRADMTKPKCEAIQFRLYDAQRLASPVGEGIDISGITLELGIKRGLMKIPYAKMMK